MVITDHKALRVHHHVEGSGTVTRGATIAAPQIAEDDATVATTRAICFN